MLHSEDADVRKHVEFCRKFSNNLDATIEDEQRSHHRTLVAYNEELKVLQRKMEESERKIANKNGGLEYKLHIMEEKVDDVTEKMLGFVTEVAQWVKDGQHPEKFGMSVVGGSVFVVLNSVPQMRSSADFQILMDCSRPVPVESSN
jgi:hypothetical protein